MTIVVRTTPIEETTEITTIDLKEETIMIMTDQEVEKDPDLKEDNNIERIDSKEITYQEVEEVAVESTEVETVMPAEENKEAIIKAKELKTLLKIDLEEVSVETEVLLEEPKELNKEMTTI